MKLIAWLVTAGYVLTTAVSASAQDVKIIANPSIKADFITSSDLKSVFLFRRQTLSDGSSVVPVLEKPGPTEKAFLRQYLDRGSEELRIYYQGLAFTGKAAMPKELGSDAEVVAYVASTKGAIGYVSNSADTAGVKVLHVSSEVPGAARALLRRVEPEYPETLRRMHIGGSVRLRLVVSPAGMVENVLILGGNPILSEAAVKAARQWIYEAAPAQSKIEVTIPFNP